MPDIEAGPKIYQKLTDAPAHEIFVDAHTSAVRELFFVRNPSLKKNTKEAESAFQDFNKQNPVPEVYIFYPWLKTVVQSVPEAEYFELRTSRNRNIISAEEQKAYRDLRVGVAGLSVGSSIVNALVLSGGPKFLRLADFDTLEVTNLNRLQAKLADVGTNKTLVSGRRVWEVDPFAELALWDKGLSLTDIEQFITQPEPLDFFVDEMDSLEVKVAARKLCRKFGIPVLMGTDNGDNVILDIERYDLEPNREFFHGLVPEIEHMDLSQITPARWLQIATQIVGPGNLSNSMKQSLAEIGRSLPAVPQLGTTAQMVGSAMSYALRKISSKEEMPSGRYIFGLENNLVLQSK